MALSNWDTLAFGPDGKPCNGVVVNDYKDHVEIYKNWLYVRSERMYNKEGSRYIEPTIASIQHGEIDLAGFDIHAKRYEDQNAIFCFIAHGPYDKPKFFGGIGCYGFNDHDWIGVKESTKQAFFEWIQEMINDYTLNSDVQHWLDKCIKSKALRYNQGDEYFAKHLGGSAADVATEVGKANETVMSKIVKGMSKKKKKRK